MPATFLINDPKWTWREWLKTHLGERPFLCLDVSDADHGPAGRVYLLREGKVRSWRLVGSVYSNRNPVDLLAGGLRMLSEAGPDVVVLGFQMRESPVLRQMSLALAECLGGGVALAPTGSSFVHDVWPFEVSQVTLPEALPDAALLAQRRARWLDMLEQATEHAVSLDKVGVYGTRIGCGTRLHGSPFSELGVYVERYGSTLLVVSDHEPADDLLQEAGNLAHTRHVSLVSPYSFDGLLCSFVRGSGEDFGIGVIKGIDFEAREMTVMNTAVAPAPVRMVRIGSVRIDMDGKESGETKPWAV